jgi:hypothetical protein
MRRFAFAAVVLHLAAAASFGFAALASPSGPLAERSAHAQGGHAQSGQVQAQVAPAGASRGAFQAGEHLFVEWQGRFWPASVLTIVDGDRAVIHYDGYGPEWDEVITSKRALHDSGSPGLANAREGASVFVEWKGAWWPAKIRAVKKDGWFIRYDGYGPEWDETVGASRVKVLQ